MANKMLRSDFMGQTLERGQQLKSSALPVQKQIQGLFGKKKVKEAKGGAQGAADKIKGSLPSFGSAKKQVKKSAPAPLKKAQKTLSKAAPGKKAAKSAKGWLGGAGGVQNLDKFYGA